MSAALAKIREGWRTGVLCDGYPVCCLRAGPHFPGEYGCIESDVAVYLPDDADHALARWVAAEIGLP